MQNCCLPTANILFKVSNEMARDNDASMFITIFMGILNTATGELIYSNAGHNPSYLIRHAPGTVAKLSDINGPPVGAMEEMQYTESRITLGKWDMIVAYTDGVPGAQNKKEELFDDARLKDVLEKERNSSPKQLAEKVIEQVKRFEAGAEQFDDITVLAVKYCQT